MPQNANIEHLAMRARQDSPPAIDVADAVVDTLSVRPIASTRLMGYVAVAASFLAVLTVAAALWTTAHRKHVLTARDDLTGGAIPSIMATVQP